MLFAKSFREDLDNLNQLASLQNQVKAKRLQVKLGKQNFHEDMKKLFEPMTDAVNNVSENRTKTISETYNINNKAIEILNEKILELMNNKGMITPYLASSLANLSKPEKKVNSDLKKTLSQPR